MVDSRSLDRIEISAALKAFEPRQVRLDGRHAAAVVIALMNDERGSVVVPLTLRPTRMRAHPGQFALPGGRLDEGETQQEAALRELHEELGLRVDAMAVLGRLDDYVTRSGYVMTPFVVWSDEQVTSLNPNPAEVAEVFAVTLAELDTPPRFVEIPESRYPVIQWPFRGHLVHAPTGAVVFQFREVVLHGRHTRIDELEQPVFAWR